MQSYKNIMNLPWLCLFFMHVVVNNLKCKLDLTIFQLNNLYIINN